MSTPPGSNPEAVQRDGPRSKTPSKPQVPLQTKRTVTTRGFREAELGGQQAHRNDHLHETLAKVFEGIDYLERQNASLKAFVSKSAKTTKAKLKALRNIVRKDRSSTYATESRKLPVAPKRNERGSSMPSGAEQVEGESQSTGACKRLDVENATNVQEGVLTTEDTANGLDNSAEHVENPAPNTAACSELEVRDAAGVEEEPSTSELAPKDLDSGAEQVGKEEPGTGTC